MYVYRQVGIYTLYYTCPLAIIHEEILDIVLE